jgi:septum formation protein
VISFPFKTTGKLILASASPRRKSLLQELGLDFEVIEAQVEEKPVAGESPQEFVLRAAGDKAGEVSRINFECWILGADTVVVHDNKILGKPRDAGDALKILKALAGRSHLVHTGFCLMNRNEKVSVSRVVTTEVHFYPFSQDVAEAYVGTEEPLDKAGAYGIQGIGGFLVEKIKGSYTNVVGLPLVEVVEELFRYKVIEPRKEKL